MVNAASIGEILTAEGFAQGFPGWAADLETEFEQPYMSELRERLVDEEQAGHTIRPQPCCVFKALDETTPDDVKVVVIGQDPYPTQGQAHGLAFSVANGERPMSFCKIIAEVNRDMDEYLPPGENQRTVPPNHTCLTPWAGQGVLLLNTILTVGNAAGSHAGWGWERFTDRIVDIINEREHTVFMLWGKKAQRKGGHVDRCRHLVLCAKHPRIGISGSRHFSCANRYLLAHNREPIDWLEVSSATPC